MITVSVLSKPIKNIASLCSRPGGFLLGNLLSLVIPSASNLAIILLATLSCIEKSRNESTYCWSSDCDYGYCYADRLVPIIAIANELAKYPEFAGLTVSQYVFAYHAIIQSQRYSLWLLHITFGKSLKGVMRQ